MITRKTLYSVEYAPNVRLVMLQTTISNYASPEPLYVLSMRLYDGEREWLIVDDKKRMRFWYYTDRDKEQYWVARDYFDMACKNIERELAQEEEPVQTVTIERAIETYKEYVN